MDRKYILAEAVVVCLLCGLGLQAQQPSLSASDNTNLSASSQPAAGTVPRLIKFTGKINPQITQIAQTKESEGGKNPSPTVLGATFSLYELPEGGRPLWSESQKVQVDEQGGYTVLLGATQPEGLPLDLFTSSKALWLGVQPQLAGQPEQPRVLLVAVPYALKSSDADTLGGLPASAFMLSANPNIVEGVTLPGPISPPAPPTSGTITGGGTATYAAMFTGPSTIGNSAIYNSMGGWVGIGTTNPAATLDVHGTGNFTGALSLAQTTGAGVGVINLGGSPFLHACCSASQQNTFVGPNAGNLTSTDTGGFNTASGSGALNANTTGSNNTASGWNALTFNTVGSGNTASGRAALYLNTTGTDNTASGMSALFSNNNASGNTAVGWLALAYNCESVSGSCAAYYNTAVGYSAGGAAYPNITGANNTFIGANSGPGTSTQLNNATAIGAGALVSASNALVLGATGVSVGIGTPAPAATLEVNGTAKFDGAVSFASTEATTGSISTSNQLVSTVATGTAPLSVASTTQVANLNASYLDGLSASAFQPVGAYATLGSNTFTGTETINGGSADGVIATTASSGYAVYANTTGTNSTGVYGYGFNGVWGTANSTNDAYGVWGIAGTGSTTYAGYFQGNVTVTGTLTSGVKDFLIDHPLDAANKYLYHSSVESSEMMNIYTGNVVLDAGGEAVVQLPDWFESLNTDFRYQLTAIGAPGPNLYIAQEVQGNSFRIAGGSPGMKVSWQVTGIRQDAYAKAHPLQVEVDKPEKERGYYIHPELYGQPKEKGVEWAHHPQQMRQLESGAKLPEPARRPGQ